MVYYPFDIVEKKVWILNTLGRIARSHELYAGKKIFFTIPTVFALEGSIEKKIVWIWNEDSFCSYMGPNQQRIMNQMASRLSVSVQVGLIKTGTYKGIG